MAGLWEEFDQSTAITTEGAKITTEIFHNEVDDHVFASAPITIVDGTVTIVTDTDDLFAVKLVVVPELYVAADIEALARHERENWYSWFVARGPVIYRIRSGRTIYPEQKLWVTIRKARGGNSSQIRIGELFFMVRHQ